MRLTDFIGRQPLYEKINRPPLHVGNYLSNRLKELKKIQQSLLSASARYKSNNHLGYDMFDRLMRYEEFRLYDIESMLGKWRLENLDHIIHDIESVISYGTDPAHGRNFWNYLNNAIKTEFSDHPDPAVLNAFDQQATDYGFAPDDEDEEYRAAREMKLISQEVIADYIKIEAIVKDMRPKIDEVIKIKNSYSGNYRPDHEEVETLYHSSCFCTEILRDGFLTEPPEERRGLGSFGNQKLISFTFSSQIAHDITKCMKEVWMIAHGQLTAKDILKWMQVEKMNLADVEKSVDLGIKIGEDKFFGTDRIRFRRIAEMTEPEMVAKLYRVYLAYSQIRVDPCFCFIDRLVNLMKTRKLSDIGILKVTVNLKKDHDYLYGESEFRLPASDVIKIERLS